MSSTCSIPNLSEILEEPIVRMLMRRDGVEPAFLVGLFDRVLSFRNLPSPSVAASSAIMPLPEISDMPGRKAVPSGGKIVFAVFADYQRAGDVMCDCQRAGFDPSDLALLAGGSARMHRPRMPTLQHGEAAGAIGSITDCLETVRTIKMMGAGPLLVAGWLTRGLSRDVAAIPRPSLVGHLIQLGLPAGAVEACLKRVVDGGILLAIRIEKAPTESVADLAMNILQRHDPVLLQTA